MCATLGLEGACFGLLCGRTQPRSRKDTSLRVNPATYSCAMFQQPLELNHDLLSVGGVQRQKCWGRVVVVCRSHTGTCTLEDTFTVKQSQRAQ